ncbi:MAG: hypothetical protein AB1Z29_05145 [Desulfobacterales bacterium]|jgi:hypothetical protein
MNSGKKDKKSQAQPKRGENPTFVIEDFLKQFRKDGISVLADLDKDDQAQIVNWAQDVVNQFGFILKENPMKIKNLVDLPCPKEDLKIAIKVLLPAYIAKRSDKIVSLLKDTYVRLSAFQEISQEDKDSVIKEVNKIDLKSDSTETELFPTYHKYI